MASKRGFTAEEVREAAQRESSESSEKTITVYDLYPYLDRAAQLAIDCLMRETGKAMDEMDTRQVRKLADELGKSQEGGETVAPCFACPRCGEAHMDALTWNHDGTTVTCGRCGADYRP